VGQRQSAEEQARGYRLNLRHAAALALVGWYLMVPPLGIHLDAVPIGPRWEIRGVYDKADQCQTDLQKWVKAARHSMTKELHVENTDELNRLMDADDFRTRFTADIAVWMFQAECIATDDPRLKGK
jgi:hypothetical protein